MAHDVHYNMYTSNKIVCIRKHERVEKASLHGSRSEALSNVQLFQNCTGKQTNGM